MKLLIDNNISYRVAVTLNKSILVCKHVSDFSLDANTEDSAIWNFAKKGGYIILTKDNDFEAMSRLFGCPPKVIQMICGNKRTPEIIRILEKNMGVIKLFDGDDENCLMFIQ